MKMLAAAALVAATLTTGAAVSATPAAAATCGCPVVHHHAVHRVVRHRTVYRYAPVAAPREDIEYREGPPPEPAYGDDPSYYDGEVVDVEPAYYGVPVWYGGGGYGGGGWGHGGGHFGGGHFGGGGGHFGGGGHHR